MRLAVSFDPLRTAVFALSLILTPALSSCAQAASATPTKAIVETVLKASWEHPATTMAPKSTMTLDNVRFGAAYPATAQEIQVEGIPAQAMVTPAIIDFTVRTYYSTETQAVHRSREARVYIDKMGDWAVMTGQVKGVDSTTSEPVGG